MRLVIQIVGGIIVVAFLVGGLLLAFARGENRVVETASISSSMDRSGEGGSPIACLILVGCTALLAAGLWMETLRSMPS